MDTKEKRRANAPVKRSGAARTAASVKRAGAPASKKRGTASNKGKSPVKRSVAQVGVATERTARRKVRKVTQKQPLPEVVYTQPGVFNRNRFLLHLATVVAAVLALIFGISIFFKVDTVTVSGNVKYSTWEVMETSGIKIGDNLIGINEAKITSNIISGLPYVDKVRVGIKLPDTVKIEIVELDVVYAVEADDGSWWLIRSDGGVIEKTNSADAELYTKVFGVQITDPEAGQKATAAQPVSQETTADGTPVPVTVNAEEQLDTAISILQYLEDSGVIGAAASVDVTDLNSLEIYYGTRYRVTLGDTTQLSYKISSMKAAVDEMGDYQSGILDVSFTTWPNEVGYTPFE